MAGIRLDIPWAQVLNSSSVLLVGAKLYVYQNHTTTPVALYTDRAATISQANPVLADAAGRFPVFYIATSQLLTITLQTSAGVPIITADDFEPFLGAQNSFQIESTAPALTFRESDQTLPLGLWRVILSGDTMRLQRNTASAGDFSSYSESITVPVTDIVDFANTPTVGGTEVALSSGAIKALGLGPGVILNGSLSASAPSGNAQTIALKGFDGNDPSSTNPVVVTFRNAFATLGAPAALVITAPLSLTISSGSTLGMTSALAARLWVCIFNDAGTPRLGIVNTQLTDGVFGLRPNEVYSSTAEGGAGAADSSGVIYTGPAVTSKAMAVLGYIESTQATAGTWVTAAAKVHTQRPGDPLPGDVLQIRRNQTGATSNGTTTMPLDDTVPQNTEGNQVMTQAITPLSAINYLEISTQIWATNSAAGFNLLAALFQDSTANALAAMSGNVAANANKMLVISINHLMAAATIATTTFKVRIGSDAAGTTTFNGASSARLFGGVGASSLRVAEVMA